MSCLILFCTSIRSNRYINKEVNSILILDSQVWSVKKYKSINGSTGSITIDSNKSLSDSISIKCLNIEYKFFIQVSSAGCG